MALAINDQSTDTVRGWLGTAQPSPRSGCRFQNAFALAAVLKEELLWRALGRRALECLDITSALRACPGDRTVGRFLGLSRRRARDTAGHTTNPLTSR